MENTKLRPSRIAMALVGGLILVLLLTWGIGAGCGEYTRWQKRQNAANEVQVTATKIRVAQQQAKVAHAQIQATRAEAQKKFVESTGIRRAQDEIQKTLTPLYVQHEAIEAQTKMAGAPNHTVIWAPTGSNGVPIVTDPLAETSAGSR